MPFNFFREGGARQIRQIGQDQYTMTIQIPPDEDGRLGRECPEQTCSPGYFKVKPGTGITGGQKEAFCPYCRTCREPSDFRTKEQKRYAREVAIGEAHSVAHDMIKEAFGVDSSGRRRLLDGFITADVEIKPFHKPYVRPPHEDGLRRDVLCPNCKLDHSVFGVAVWCADCGKDIFTTHILGELRVVKVMLGDVERRRAELGVRVATHDIENALEDLVSVFESSLKIEMRRWLKAKSFTAEKIDVVMKEIGSKLQSVSHASVLIPKHCDRHLLFEQNTDFQNRLDLIFQKRHPITHNFSVVDRSYLQRVRTGEIAGREVRVSKAEVEQAANDVFSILENFHLRLFPEAAKAETN